MGVGAIDAKLLRTISWMGFRKKNWKPRHQQSLKFSPPYEKRKLENFKSLSWPNECLNLDESWWPWCNFSFWTRIKYQLHQNSTPSRHPSENSKTRGGKILIKTYGVPHDSQTFTKRVHLDVFFNSESISAKNFTKTRLRLLASPRLRDPQVFGFLQTVTSQKFFLPPVTWVDNIFTPLQFSYLCNIMIDFWWKFGENRSWFAFAVQIPPRSLLG